MTLHICAEPMREVHREADGEPRWCFTRAANAVTSSTSSTPPPVSTPTTGLTRRSNVPPADKSMATSSLAAATVYGRADL